MTKETLGALIDAITAYLGWVDLVLLAVDDETVDRRLRGLHRARRNLLRNLAAVERELLGDLEPDVLA